MAGHDDVAAGGEGAAVGERDDIGGGGGIASGGGAIDWPWITGKIITATGWSFETLHASSFADVLELLEYWQEEPPAHVLLALRYLGPQRHAKRGIDAAQARKDLGQMAQMMGTAPAPLPVDLKEMVRAAEAMRTQHRGL